ncbi:MAG: LuxR C-terminal-related transcriptional regulator [Pseudonocardiaceae bacterium]
MTGPDTNDPADVAAVSAGRCGWSSGAHRRAAGAHPVRRGEARAVGGAARARPTSDVAFLRVLLIDGHRMLTDVLTARLSVVSDMWVAGTCTTDDPRLTDLVRTLRPDVITTEVGRVPVETGRILRTLGVAEPAARLVVLTGSQDTAHAVAAAREGAAAWVSKESSVEHLVGVLRAVRKGHACYPPRQLGAVLRELRDDVRHAQDRSERLDVLSDREREVLFGMIDGKPVGQIAVESRISPNTVRTHVRSIFTKLDVHSRLEAVRVARGAGLRPSVQAADGGRSALALPERELVPRPRRASQ